MTIDKQDQRRLARWAAGCADHVLRHFEDRYPRDRRPRAAVAAARAWARGALPFKEVRAAALAAHAAARGAAADGADAACFAARAAGHAAATAHVAGHAGGAASYAAKAAAVVAADRELALHRRHLDARLWPVGLPPRLVTVTRKRLAGR